VVNGFYEITAWLKRLLNADVACISAERLSPVS